VSDTVLVPTGAHSSALLRHPGLAALTDKREAFVEKKHAENTKKAYSADMAQYIGWCQTYDLNPLEPARTLMTDQVSLYLTAMAETVDENGRGYKASTLVRHLAAIADAYRDAGGGNGLSREPLIANTLKGIKKDLGSAVDRKKPLMTHDVQHIQEEMAPGVWPNGVSDARDTFVILLGYVTAMRREEVAALTLDHIEWSERGLLIHIGRSKGDQEGQGVVLPGPYLTEPWLCMPCAWTRWASILNATGSVSVTGNPRPALMRAVFTNAPTWVERQTDWVDDIGPALIKARKQLARNLAAPGTSEEDAHERHMEKVWPLVAGFHVCSGPGGPAPDTSLLESDAPVFRAVSKHGAIGESAVTGSALNEMLKARIDTFKADAWRHSFHSLRAGAVTEARRNGADNKTIRDVTRHKSDQMIEVYDRDNRPFKPNALAQKLVR
jgi:integrase